MPPVVVSATEFIVRLPKHQRTLDDVLQAASVVGGDVLAACTRRDHDNDIHHITVGDEELYAPHFRSTYRRAVSQVPILVISGLIPDDLDTDLLTRLPASGVAIHYTYCSVRDHTHFNLAVQTSDNLISLPLLREGTER